MASEKSVDLKPSDWEKRWTDGHTSFHQGRSEPFLLESEEKIFEGKKKSVFVPLCGKAEDLFWLYEKGHTVCGVEFAEQAIKEFLEDHSLEHEVIKVDGVGTLFQTKDGRMKLYQADVFKTTVNVIGQFDVIYDCRSITAINVSDRQLYKELLLSLMKETAACYMYTYDFDTAFWPGPPHASNEATIRALFEDKCEVELLRVDRHPMANGTSTEPPEVKPANIKEAIQLMPYCANIWYKIHFRS